MAAETVVIVAAAAVVGMLVGEKVNELVHDQLEDKIVPIPMFGRVQKKMPLVRQSRHYLQSHALPQEEPGQDEENEDELVQDGDMTDRDWAEVPHIRTICHMARDRAGFLSYYWIKKFVVLNKMYLDWLHTIPMDSPIHMVGNYEKVFVELHLKHFHCGVYGRTRSTYPF